MHADLHMHSTASDGTDAPEALGPLAAEAGLSAIALTDHDTTDGLDRCAAGCEAAGIDFITGVELSVDPGGPAGTLHLLGYFIRPDEPALLAVTETVRSARSSRNPRMIAALNDLGLELTESEVAAQASGEIIGRPHIAAAMVARGYVHSIDEAFHRYIGRGGAAYVRRDLMPAERAIDAIHAADGLAVLAHPIQLACRDDAQLERTLRRLVDAGLDGIEAFHSDHDRAAIRRYLDFAERFNLLVTGGSDYHGRRKPIHLGDHGLDADRFNRLRESAHRRAQAR